MTTYHHWAIEPFVFDPTWVYEQSGRDRHAYKPNGLWFEVDGDWQRWCGAEQWGQDRLNVRYEVRFDPSEMLVLQTARDLDQFTEAFHEPIYAEQSPDPYYHGIAWRIITQRWPGIIIAPYIWERRLDLMWYYTWDCASGCVWDLQRAKVELVGEAGVGEASLEERS